MRGAIYKQQLTDDEQLRAHQSMEDIDRPAAIDFQRIWTVVRNFDGWLTEGQALLLWRSAMEAPGGRFAEIGSHQGKSAAILVCSRAGARLLAVDPWDDSRWGGGSESFDRFCDNLHSVGGRDRVEIFRRLSSQAFETLDPQRIFDLVYIDGAHDYTTARRDIASWRTRISKHGFLGIHDCFSSVGVTRALLEELLPDRDWRYLGSERSLAIFKRERDPWLKWFLGRLFMAGRLWWFVRNLIIKSATRRSWGGLARALGHRQETDPF